MVWVETAILQHRGDVPGYFLILYKVELSLASCLDVMAGQPVAWPVSFQVEPAVSDLEQQLIGTDPDGDILTYEFLDNPSGTGYTNATVDPQSGILSLTIVAGFTGEIRLHYRVTDGRLFSAPATIRIFAEPSSEDLGRGLIPIDPEVYASFESSFRSSLTDLPPRIDLSEHFPVPDSQGDQGSCVGWATAYALKSYQEKLENGWPLDTNRHLFSPAFIYNQLTCGVDPLRARWANPSLGVSRYLEEGNRVHCRDGGTQIYMALELIKRDGATTLAIMPYNKDDHRTQPDNAVLQEAAKFKAATWRTVNGTRDIKSWLAAGTPVVIAIRTCRSFEPGLRQSRGIAAVYNTLWGGDCGGHAVTITGYDDTIHGGAFRVINSYGANWGDNGYFWLPYNFYSRAIFTSPIFRVEEAYVLFDAENQEPREPVDPGPPPDDELPNLQVQNWSATYDPKPRGQGHLRYSVINTGTGVAPRGADVNLMLSENQRITSADYFVVWETISDDLRPGAAVVRDEASELAFSFPDDLPEGTYWMAVWVDDLDAVRESNEDDNVSLDDTRVTIQTTDPDLYVRNWYARWDGQGNGTLTYRVDNIGQASVDHGLWDINLILSPDDIVGNGNEILLLYEAATHILDPGEWVYRDDNNSAYFSIYQDAFGGSVPAGLYYMALWVDDLDLIEESNELNNYSLGGNQVRVSYASSPVVTSDGNRGSRLVGAKAVVEQNLLVQSTRQTPDRLYNGYELPPHDALVKKVRIERSPQGGTSLTVVEDATSSDTTSPSLSEAGDDEFPVHAQQRHSADVVIFPIVEEFVMPQNNSTNQGGK